MPARVSLCLIAKNEEGNLPTCLRSVAGLVAEIIVVDTGSTDRTKEFAARHGSRVVEFTWVDSFAAARNESLRHATGDWIFWLDGDEFLNDENRAKLQTLFNALGDEAAAYVMRQRSASQIADGPPTLVEHCRLFRNHPDLRWSYRIHEQILPAINCLGHEVRFTDISIDHSGYTDPQRLQEKIQRNLRLLLLEEAEQPDDPFTLFNLAWAYLESGQLERGVAYAKRSLERSGPGDSIVRKLFALLARAHDGLGKRREALAWCRAGRARCPDDAELLFQEGVLLAGLGDQRGAETALRTLLDIRPAENFASVDAGLRGHKGRHHLALVLQAQGRADDAEEQWRRALAERPAFAPAWEGLAGLYLGQGRWEPFEEAVRHLPVEGAGAVVGRTLQARAHLARRECTAARRLFEKTVTRFPLEIGPRVYLTRALLEEGQDPAAAEKALRELAGRAPREVEAWRNLALLLKQQGRLAEAVAVCRAGLDHCRHDPGLLVQQGVYLVGLGQLAEAEAALLRGLEVEPAGGQAATARHWLALVYLRQGRDREAEAQWRALLVAQPLFAGAWEGLAEIALKRRRWEEVKECAGQMEALPDGEMEASILRARIDLGRREFGEARRRLEDTIQRHPEAVKPRLFRSRVLLEEGDDDGAAQALQDVLDLDPGNREARHNLDVLKNGHKKTQKAQKEERAGSEPTRAPLIHRKCLRIGLASYYPRPFRTETPYEQPLGGSESALCYLAEALAGQGQEVFLLNAGGATGISRGVPCLPLTPAGLRQLPALDVFVVQNFAGQGRVLRQALGPQTRLIFWTGHAAIQPGVQPLRDPAERATYDAFVMVSDWQRAQYQDAFELDPGRTMVIPNGISPAFRDLYGPEESIVAAKARPPVVAYTSTPDRGLEWLLEAFPRIRAAVPGVTLEVYTGLRLYGFSESEDRAQFGALYQMCRETEGVELVGPVAQPELARRLRRVAVLAYPNTVPETFCIAVREALAAGCAVVTSALGALPETTAGLARLVPFGQDRAAYLDRFVAETVASLEQITAAESAELERQLRRQVDQINATSCWPALAGHWRSWLHGLA
jgi:tetratricopeptide (TPR) repeat protein/glycosyltransferase involved in cell wall biosynthesis